MPINPFFCGNPVPVELFVGRNRELRKIVSRILNGGQSSAIIGEPRSGKTSLLHYISASEIRTSLYGSKANRIIFSEIDAQTLGNEFSIPEFWSYILQSTVQQITLVDASSSLSNAYKICQENQFGTFVLERLFLQMYQQKWQLVLMLDEFDMLLHHQILNSAEFFGSLRSLATRCKGALCVIIASRASLSDLNKNTQKFNRTGSPYFNFLDESTLGILAEDDVLALLHKRGSFFSKADIVIVSQLSGKQPYYTQLAAFQLWDTYEEYSDMSTLNRWTYVGINLLLQVNATMQDTWRNWSPIDKKAFFLIGLAQFQWSLFKLDQTRKIENPNAKLAKQISDRFNLDELKELLFELDISFEEFPEGNKRSKIREVVEYFHRRNQFPELLNKLKQHRPRVSWTEPIKEIELILKESSRFGSETKHLEERGFIKEDQNLISGWRIQSLVIYWWLVESIFGTIYREHNPNKWFRENALDGVVEFTKQNELGALVHYIYPQIENIEALIKADIEEIANSVTI